MKRFLIFNIFLCLMLRGSDDVSDHSASSDSPRSPRYDCQRLPTARELAATLERRGETSLFTQINKTNRLREQYIMYLHQAAANANYLDFSKPGTPESITPGAAYTSGKYPDIYFISNPQRDCSTRVYIMNRFTNRITGHANFQSLQEAIRWVTINLDQDHCVCC